MLGAKEYCNIYAQIALQLCIGKIKWQLEDFYFRFFYPDKYKHIANLLHESRIDREQFIDNFVISLRHAMNEQNIQANIYGRPKHIYSIWRKMKRKHLAFEELFDIQAVRVVVECLQDCYAALEIVHTYFHHIPNQFDDYIANPKHNGYQSIHTVILDYNGKALEIQIRTHQMHENAELGLAAHWKYKEGTVLMLHLGYEDRIAWLNKFITCPNRDEGMIL